MLKFKLTLLLVLLFANGLMAQRALPFSPTRPAFRQTHSSALRHNSHSRSSQSIFIDFDNTDQQYDSLHGGTYNEYLWPLNIAYPDDSFHNNYLNWAATEYDTIIDIVTGGGTSINSSAFSLDSIIIPYRFIPTATGHDTVTVSVYKTSTGITINPNNINGTISNTVLFSKKFPIVTATNPIGAEDLLIIYPNLNFPSGGAFAIGVNFTGNLADTFYIAGGGGDLCGGSCLDERSSAGNNAIFKQVFWETGSDMTFNTVDSSLYYYFDCDQSGGPTPGGCEYWYLQNFNMYTAITLNGSIPLRCTASAGNASICAGQSSSLSANATGGIGNYSYSWSPSAGLSNSAVSNPIANPIITTTYTVTVSDGNSTTTAQTTIIVHNCGNSSCNADSTIFIPGLYPVSDSIPCIIRNQPYSTILTLRSWDSITIPGIGPLYIDSVRIDSINNLPCGISWACNVGYGHTYSNFELGCIQLSGTTTDSAGQYKLNIYATFYIQGFGSFAVDLITAGVRKDIRVINNSGTCPTVDTSSGTILQTGCNNSVGYGALSVSITGNTGICYGQSTNLTANATGGTGWYTYHWASLPGLSCASCATTSVAPSATSTYMVTVSDGINSVTAQATVPITLCAAASCGPDSTVGVGIYPISDSIPCIIQGQPYNTSLTIRMWGGITLPQCDSIMIYSIDNLPCGITWNCNKGYGGKYTPYELGCIELSGTTNDSIGQYLLVIKMVLYYNLILSPDTIDLSSNLTNVRKDVRVISAGSSCPSIDTSPNATLHNGCNNNPNASFSANINGIINICTGETTRLTAIASGGQSNYQFTWSTGDVTQDIFVSTAGYYSLTVSDGNNSVVSAVYVNVNNSLSFNALITPDDSCTNSGGAISISTTNGLYPYVYLWSNGNTTNLNSNLTAGQYAVTVTDSTGCTGTYAATITIPCDSVWPGDADDNSIADYNDYLMIYYEYANSGAARPNATIQWVGQAGPAWGTSSAALNYSVNDKFIDCNGDGVINDYDTLAITANYSLTHSKTGSLNHPRAGDPDLVFVPVSDTISAASNFYIKVMLGNSVSPVDSLFALAFSLNYDPSIFDTSGVQLNLSNSWMGTPGTNLMSVRKPLPGTGELVMVIGRTDKHNISGYGQIGELVLKTQPHFPGGANSTVYTITPQVLRGVTASGTPRTFNIQNTQVAIDTTGAVGIDNVSFSQSVNLYPNPSNGHFVLTIDQPAKQLDIELLNIQGQRIYIEQLKDVASLNKEFNFSDLAKGVYLLKVSTENGVAVKRVVME